MTVALALIGCAVIAGAVAQRITGLGFTLVSGPFLVLALGPFQGILLCNVLSMINSLVILSMTFRAIELRRALLLGLPAIAVGVPAGAWVLHRLPAAMLAVGIAGSVIIALLAVLWSPRMRVFHGWRGAAAAGALSGFMNVTAGVGGPAITLYAVSISWAHRNFVPTIQLYSALVNAASLTAKGLPDLSVAEMATAVLALGLGTATGQLVSKHVPAQRAWAGVIGLSLAGAVVTLIKGLTSL